MPEWYEAGCTTPDQEQVSILMLSRNRLGALARALASLYPILDEGPDFARFYIIDHNSQDGAQDFLLAVMQRHPQHFNVELRSDNLGVAGGRQRLLSKARGRVCLFLDNDVAALEPRWWPLLVQPLDDPRVGVVGHGGHMIPGDWSWYQRANPHYFGPVDVVSGYCQAFRREVTRQHNAQGFGLVLDMTYNPYWHEDSDWCLQAQQYGLSVLQAPAPIQHLYSGTGDDGSGQAKQRYLTNKFQGRGLIAAERKPTIVGFEGRDE